MIIKEKNNIFWESPIHDLYSIDYINDAVARYGQRRFPMEPVFWLEGTIENNTLEYAIYLTLVGLEESICCFQDSVELEEGISDEELEKQVFRFVGCHYQSEKWCDVLQLYYDESEVIYEVPCIY